MVRVLVVCSANISRSQSLAHVLNALGKEQGLPVVVKSAGVDKKEIEEIHHDQRAFNLKLTPSPWVKKFMEEPGLSTRMSLNLTPATVVTPRMLKWADIVLAVEPKIIAKLQKQFPGFSPKVRLVTHYSKGRIKNPKERRALRAADKGLSDAHWRKDKPNPPEYAPGILKGSDEAKRMMFERSKKISEQIVTRWKKNLPFSTPRQQRSARRLGRHLQRKRGK